MKATIAALHMLAQKRQVEKETIAPAIKELKVDSEKAFPHVV
ncbi:MAG: hypothetical protein ABSH14_15100 [Verrucomicrobiia bacterium]|jgi:pyruvate dehydrogenase complex dehydrogenase (E1) component